MEENVTLSVQGHRGSLFIGLSVSSLTVGNDTKEICEKKIWQNVQVEKITLHCRWWGKAVCLCLVLLRLPLNDFKEMGQKQEPYNEVQKEKVQSGNIILYLVFVFLKSGGRRLQRKVKVQRGRSLLLYLISLFLKSRSGKCKKRRDKVCVSIASLSSLNCVEESCWEKVRRWEELNILSPLYRPWILFRKGAQNT